jgi:hypothetical protein
VLVVQLDTHNTTEVIVKPELSPLGLWRNATATTLLGSDTGNLVAIDLKTGAHAAPSFASAAPSTDVPCLLQCTRQALRAWWFRPSPAFPLRRAC